MIINNSLFEEAQNKFNNNNFSNAFQRSLAKIQQAKALAREKEVYNELKQQISNITQKKQELQKQKINELNNQLNNLLKSSNFINLNDFKSFYNKLPNSYKQNLNISFGSLQNKRTNLLNNLKNKSSQAFHEEFKIEDRPSNWYIRSFLSGQGGFYQKVYNLLSKENILPTDSLIKKIDQLANYAGKINANGLRSYSDENLSPSQINNYKSQINNFIKNLTNPKQVTLASKKINLNKEIVKIPILTIEVAKPNPTFAQKVTALFSKIPVIHEPQLRVLNLEHSKKEQAFLNKVKSYAKAFQNQVLHSKVVNINQYKNILNKLNPLVRQYITLTPSDLLVKRKQLLQQIQNDIQFYDKSARHENGARNVHDRVARNAYQQIYNKLKNSNILVNDYTLLSGYALKKAALAEDQAFDDMQAQKKRQQLQKQAQNAWNLINKGGWKKINFDTNNNVTSITTKDGKVINLNNYSNAFKHQLGKLFDNRINLENYKNLYNKYNKFQQQIQKIKNPTKSQLTNLNNLVNRLNNLSKKIKNVKWTKII